MVVVAVEAALRGITGAGPGKMNLKDLIGRAEREGRIPREWADRLDAARQLRKGFAHADGQRVFTVGMTAPVLAAAHEVRCLLVDDVRRSRSSLPSARAEVASAGRGPWTRTGTSHLERNHIPV